MDSLSRRAALLTLAGAGAAAVAAAEPAVAAASRNRLVVIGDSWAAGLHARPAHALGQVAAAAIGWRVHVDAVSGSGYLDAAGQHATYPHRADTIAAGAHDRIVVVQGGSNDIGLGIDDLPAAFDRTVHRLRLRFPHAALLILGPGPDPWPVTAGQRRIDHVLALEARRRDATYVSMLQERWITAANLDRVIDPATIHPTVAGQRYLGRRLASAVVHAHPGLAHLV